MQNPGIEKKKKSILVNYTFNISHIKVPGIMDMVLNR